jgi:hypothetical protein
MRDALDWTSPLSWLFIAGGTVVIVGFLWQKYLEVNRNNLPPAAEPEVVVTGRPSHRSEEPEVDGLDAED